jgi:predicted transcriptional regulator YheO
MAKPKQQVKNETASGLSAADRLLIDSYKTTMEGLAAYYGEAFEFVLHDLTDYDHSIIKIINGFHSGRKEGAPITDLALSMLEQIQQNGESGASRPFISYTSKSKYGKPVRSTTIGIFGEKRKAVGLLCVNLDLDSPLNSLLQNFSPVPPSGYVTENFSSDSDELIAKSLEKVKAEVEADDSIPPTQKNKEIVTILYHQGIFKLKNAVQAISVDLGISKNTVYLHIRQTDAPH